MRLGPKWLLAALPVLAAPVGGADAAPPSATGATVETDPLASAAVDTWPMQDGCPARTRATDTRAILGKTETAWTYDAPGWIEGDPRVWGDWVVVASHAEKKAEGYLDVLRLTDGKPVVTRKTYPHQLALEPVIWQDFVFVRKDAETVDAMRIVPELRMLSTGRIIKSDAPLLVLPGGDLIASMGLRVERRRLGQDDPVWSSRFRRMPTGGPSARGGRIHVVTDATKEGYKGREVFLESISLADGRGPHETAVGWTNEIGSGDSWSDIVLGRDEAFARLGRGLQLESGWAADGVRAILSDGRAIDGFPYHPGARTVTQGARSVVSRVNDTGKSELILSAPAESDRSAARAGSWSFTVLASVERHPQFANPGASPVIARGIYIGPAGAFDLESFRILETYAPPRQRVVIPARETLLVLAGSNRLEARRAPRASTLASGPSLVTDLSLPRVELPGSTAATVDGVLTTGGLAFDPKTRRVTGGKDALRVEDVGLLLDKSGRIVHGPDAAFVSRALPRVARTKTRAEWIAVARKTVQTHDADALRRAIADVIAHGGRQDDVVIPLQRELTILEKPTALTPKPDTRRIAEIDTLRAGLQGVEAKTVWAAFASLADDVPFAYRADVLRAVLETDANQLDAVSWLKARLPEGVVPPAPFRASDWLDLVEAAAQTPIRGIAVEGAKERKDLTPDERALAAARATWRRDLVGLRSERLLVVTPVAQPARIARCLSLGELVCSTLDGIFSVREKPGASVDPLVIYLHESKDDYVAHSASAGAGADGKAFVEWTLGHYSPSDGISRLYVPAERDAFESVMSVFAHELTHHWLDKRMPPAPGPAKGSRTSATPAYFLEEGFATMVEEFLFDLRTRTATTLDPRADSLDAVAATPTLLPWKTLVELSSAGFRALDRTPSVEIPCRWTIGIHRNLSQANLFYSQAAAVCHYLFEAEGAKHRPILLAWIQDLHAGRTKVGDIERRLGMVGTQLGDAVWTWSQKVSAGR